MSDTYFVYNTICIVNYKCYIGLTHKPISSGYIGSGHLMKRAIKKYGKSFFIRHDLFSGTKEECSKVERYYTDLFSAPTNKEFYNLRDGGFNGGHNEDSRKKMSESCKSAWKSKRDVYIKAFSTRDHSNVGKHDRSGNKNPMFGKSHTKESRKLMSESHLGKRYHLSDEQLKKKINTIKSNEVMMGNKSDVQKAKNRWAALRKHFAKTPVISDDIKMMHDFYRFNEGITEFSADQLLEYLKFRFRFLQEEIDEGTRAIENKNWNEVCDSLIDLIVVAIGTIDIYQIDFKKSWYRVLEANMSKERGVNKTRPNPLGLPDLVKPQGFVAPSHTDNLGLLEKI